MAFVPPTTASTFLSGAPLPSKCSPQTRRAPAPARVRMAFSSIDMPECAGSLADVAVSTKAQVIHMCYKHVFGNAYLMESERDGLAVAESDFKLNNLSVRELVRAMGKSEAYRKRFFERSGPYRFVELNCKHFLGRGPVSQEEVSFHVQKLINEGYDAEIDSYVDCAEYERKFGMDFVPRFVFEGTYQRNDNFNRLAIMRKHWDGCSTSTVSGSTAPGKPIPAQLCMGHGGYVNGFIGVMKGLPAGFRPEPSRPPVPGPFPSNGQAGLKIRIKVAENLYQVYEMPSITAKVEPAWKKERAGEKRWNGVWF